VPSKWNKTVPLISVVIPAYNAEKTIKSAIDSVLAQTFRDIEIVVCDDNSTDNTREILASYTDSRLVTVFNDNNLGAGRARDRSIAEARGDWIALLDADDAWHPERLEKLLNAAGECEKQILFDNILTCHDVGGGLRPWRSVRGNYAFRQRAKTPTDITFEHFISSRRLLCKLLIPKALIQENKVVHSSRKFAEDIDFLVSLIASGGKLRYIPEALYYYRVTPSSVTGQTADHSLMRQCLEECLHAHEWTLEEVGAFKKKIGMLREDETLYAVRDALRKRDIANAITAFLSYPKAIRALPYRFYTGTTYEWHRRRHGGATR
jgi:succinoglycan biosynthesis protein ExoO